MVKALHIAAITRETAEKRAEAIRSGRIPCLRIYETREAADEWYGFLNVMDPNRYTVHEISIPAEQQERDAA